MRQWELFGITDTVPAWTPPKRDEARDATQAREPEPEPWLDPAAEGELDVEVAGFPNVLWTTDTALRFTSAPGTTRLGLPDAFDVLDICGPGEGTIIEAHMQALGGSAATFTLHRNGRTFRCWVSPVRASDGQVCGTICVGLEIDADLVFDATVEYA